MCLQHRAHCCFPPADGRNVAIGKVILGLETIVRASGVFAVNMRPATPVTISACGALPESQWDAVDKAISDAAKLASNASAPAAAAGKVRKEAKAQQPAAHATAEKVLPPSRDSATV